MLRTAQGCVAAAVFLSSLYFFQGGGWNQNAHFITTMALVEQRTVYVDRWRDSTGDLAHAASGVVSNKPIATALLSIPAYLVARALTAFVDNDGNRFVLRAYFTAVLTAGVALTAIALVLFRLLQRWHAPLDAALVALATTLATPLLPNSTMQTSHPLASLAALGCFALLVTAEAAPSRRRLIVAGALAMAPGALEYQLAVLALPFGVYALWRFGKPALWMLIGGAAVALVPLVHHVVVYGHPLRVGYGALVDERLARDAAVGFLGFDGLSLLRLYELTLGTSRGFFFLSPYLLACVPGLTRLWKIDRGRAALSAAVGWGVLLLVACLVYWHSGSAVGSRYAVVFVVFAAFPVAAILPHHRRWIAAGMAVGFCFMLLATSVTAIPPTPRREPPYENVVGWYWQRWQAGQMSSWQQPIVIDRDLGDGAPTLPYAFNLGLLGGLKGRWSLLPYLALLALVLRPLVVAARQDAGRDRGGIGPAEADTGDGAARRQAH